MSLVAASGEVPFPDDPADTGATFLRSGAASTAEVVEAEAGPSVAPVAPEPELVDTTGLLKATQLAEQEVERVAAEQEAERVEAERVAAQARVAPEQPVAAPADCGLRTSGLGAVKSHVRAAAEFLGCRFGEPTMYGVAGRGGPSDHPVGLAVDFMVDRSTGDALADCALANMDALGVKYVIWRQRINHGDGWKPMEDRGGVTANHFDHVHVSFDPSAGGDPRAC